MFMKNYFNKLNSYVIYLFPLVVLTGFTIAQGAALLSIIIAFFFLSKHEIKLIFQNKLIMFLALFCVYILFNTLLNSNTVTLTSGYANPELAADSGNIIYLENRKPIQRASDQTEDIKVIIEF